MADHGEALGEHGEATHGIFLYDETIRVPLLFKLPQGRSAGQRIENRVQLVDVQPTILQTAGIAIPPQVQGQSLLPVMKPTPGKEAAAQAPLLDRPAYSESDYPHRTFGWSSLHALRTGKYLFIDAPRKELYDQSTDPKSEHNLFTASLAVPNTLGSQLETFRQKTSSAGEAPTVAADPELQEKLAALGYLSDSTSSPMLGIKDSGADPKDKVEVVNLLHQAEMLKEDMSFDEAVPLLERVIILEPHLPIAYLQLGTALTSLKQYEKALPVLRKAVDMRPDLIIPRYQLASALFETGDFAASAVELETIVSRSPGWGEARFLLATTYARMDRMPDAIEEYQKVIEVMPNHYAAHLLLGRALSLTGDQAAALPELTKAASLHPESPEPHRFLADAYTQLGRTADAEREQAKANRLRPLSR
jgi:choline-sulfatase